MVTLNDIRAVEWGKTYSWDINFPDAPSPFDKWFPAIDVDLGIHDIKSYNFTTMLQDFSVPQSMGVRSLKVTFHDDENCTLFHWMEDWGRYVFGNGEFVRVIGDPQVSRAINIIKLNSKREPIGSGEEVANEVESKSIINRFVYPDGGLSFIGNSSSEARVYSASFIVVA